MRIDVDREKLRIAAVVLTYKGEEVLPSCLEALMAQTRPLDEIIVIDNGGDVEALVRKYPHVTYRKIRENVGSSGGHYQAINAAYMNGHDWIWVMDDDAMADRDALEQLLRCELIAKESTYALVSTVLNKDRTINLVHRRLLTGTVPMERHANQEWYREKSSFETDTVTFMGMLIGRHAISRIGLPLHDLFIYYDDTEYSLRIRKGGGKIFTITTSYVVDTDTHRPSIYEREYYLRRNMLHVYKRYAGRSLTFYRIVLVTIVTTSYQLALGVMSILKWRLRILIAGQPRMVESRSDQLRRSYMLWLGIMHGLTGRLGKWETEL